MSDEDAAVSATWVYRGGAISVDRPIVVGILNVTPDSFSDGGQHVSVADAVRHVERMVREGADVVDIGGESTRPQGASVVVAEEEVARVIPIVREVRARFPELPLSVDTTKSRVADEALRQGANIINDVSGFRLDPRMREIAAKNGAAVILMHSRGTVQNMGTYQHAQYGSDVVGEVMAELMGSIHAAREGGIADNSIVIDPGIGFAKEMRHSLELLASLHRFSELGYPVMVGVSRKRFVGELSKVAKPSDRVAGTVGANVAALMSGARIFRVHDVAPNRQALDVAWGILRASVASAATKGGRGARSPFPVPRSHPR